jgi:hypothetical protein
VIPARTAVPGVDGLERVDFGWPGLLEDAFATDALRKAMDRPGVAGALIGALSGALLPELLGSSDGFNAGLDEVGGGTGSADRFGRAEERSTASGDFTLLDLDDLEPPKSRDAMARSHVSRTVTDST